MGCFKFPVTVLSVLLLLELRYSAGDFPFENCYTGEFDILVLERPACGYLGEYAEGAYILDISNIWLTKDDPTKSRVTVTSVITPKDITKNVEVYGENRKFMSCLNSENLTNYITDKDTVQGEIRMQIKIASNLFDCGMGRENSTYVAIIVVSCSAFFPLTTDEMWQVPEILQKEMLNFKVFVLLLGATKLKEPIFMRNTLYSQYSMVTAEVWMALCKSCPDSWIKFENPAELASLSCYTFSQFRSPYYPYSICGAQSSILATIESQQELSFLQNWFGSYLKNNKNWTFKNGSLYIKEMLIGLKRDTGDYVKKFQWSLPSGSRPLVLNHWLLNEPDGGLSQSCGVWIFYGKISNHTELSAESNTGIDTDVHIELEGWASTACNDSKTHLCETSLSFQLPEKLNHTMQPANKDSYQYVLTKRGFREFNGQIVSISAYASNEEFYKILKDNKEEFPLFDCGEDADDPRYIAYTYVCDLIDQCSNRKDETDCFFPTCEVSMFYDSWIHGKQLCGESKNCQEKDATCSLYRCHEGNCLPQDFFNIPESDCIECQTGFAIYETERFLNEKCIFICNTNNVNIYGCIFSDQLNNSKTDCIGPEGHLDVNLGKLVTANTCFDKQNQTIWSPKCVYIRDKLTSIIGCRDVSHLQNCSDFQCPEGYYKCPGRYCIPINYVLDGKNDCPSGEDERRVLNHSCEGNFACWASQVCLHPDLVCDSHPDCPNKDDELNCDDQCFEGLRCIAGTLTVEDKSVVESNSQVQSIDIDIEARYIDVSGVDTPLVFGKRLDILFFVKLSKCNLKENVEYSCLGYFYMNVNTLDLSYNALSGMPIEKFPNLIVLNMSFNPKLKICDRVGLKRLEMLDLASTGLLYFEKTCFESLTNLKHLNLSNTQLSTWNKYYLPPSFTLQTLDLRGAPVINFFEDTFNGLIIKSSLYANNFGLCCPQIRGNGVPSYMCHATEDAISSCTDLIGVEIQRILIWVTAGGALLGNLTVILFRLIWDKSVLKKAYGLFVLNLGISDLIMGVYLFLIAGADVYYRGVYVLYDKEWKESIICKIASFLATLSSETTTFFIFLITVDRFLVLKFPFGERKFSKTTKIIAVSLAWGISFVLALIPVVPTFRFDSIISSNAMCVDLLLTNQLVSGWEFSLGVFIVLNFVMFSLIALGQVAIFKSMSGNRTVRESTNQNSLRRAQDITVAKQLSLVVLSNFLCWFPVGFMGFLSLSGHMISNDVYAWTAVLVLPVNSAFNPLLYTIPILITKWEKFKYGESYPPHKNLQ